MQCVLHSSRAKVITTWYLLYARSLTDPNWTRACYAYIFWLHTLYRAMRFNNLHMQV